MNSDFFGPHDFVQTSPCGRGEHHMHGLVGVLWRIVNPESVRIGLCFMGGRLKKNDLWLCISHSGDCFQRYMFVEENANCLIGRPEISFGSYGIGNSVALDIAPDDIKTLQLGGRVVTSKSENKMGTGRGLKPCPWCGKVAELYSEMDHKYGYGRLYTILHSCKVMKCRIGWYKAKEKPIELWNRRV